MAQYTNEHLTTAQISAYLDKELAADELSLCRVHLQSCQNCQDLLTDFRVTSSLLRGMPQVDVPRSFALPLNIATLPRTSDDIPLPRAFRQTSQGQQFLGRSLRILSTLAAVLGLIFILAGAIGSLPRGSMSSSTATTSSGVEHPNTAQDTTPTLVIHKSPNAQASQQILPTSTPESIATVPGQIHQIFPATPPALLDPGQPLGRLGIGSLLFLLGILGVVLTRRFRYRKTHA